MAFHAGAGAVCLFGGDHAPLQTGLEQPWLWHGRQWTRREADGGPPLVSLVAVAADPARRSVLAHGGKTLLAPKQYGTADGVLWELDADLKWRRRIAEGPEPGPRHHHAMAFDSARGRLVMYGGLDAADRWTTDVWEWDRERWHRIQPAIGPGERAHHAMAFDSRRGRLVLRGGTQSNRSRPADTWEWDGAAWHRAAAEGPGPGNGYRMAYDENRGVVVLCGGDTVLWDGKSWTRAVTSEAPAPRAVHAMAYDPRRQRVVLYGGSANNANLADTWEWDGAAWQEIRAASGSDRPVGW